MESREITSGRRIAVLLRPGDDVLAGIVAACREHRIEQGVIVTLLGAFTTVTLIGTTGPIEDPHAPLAESVTVEGVEGTGSGTIAATDDGPLPHIHLAVGIKGEGAAGYTGHLLAATAHYVVEVVIDEVLSPALIRRVDDTAAGLPTLAFG
ncbi:MAG: DNA-binding protein [Microbacterium sp.]|uniref:PPC domain-containing DNA-binding protein n=1 Tax=Microbacterium sp. TaxID=51671 RepID=UPI00271B0C83|nr:PPC domain-containing DNA-binding protein [Microbacterium sp.]MDO8382779.1 DNA-binding protein [Microbacterium sp.]